MKLKVILLVVLMFFITACDTSMDAEEEIDSYCMNTEFKDQSNVYDICEEIYDSYNSYLGGDIEKYVSGNRAQSINACIDDFYISFENYKYNYAEGCSDFIIGSGGYGEIFLPRELSESLSNWCENNYYINEEYFKCIGR